MQTKRIWRDKKKMKPKKGDIVYHCLMCGHPLMVGRYVHPLPKFKSIAKMIEKYKSEFQKEGRKNET